MIGRRQESADIRALMSGHRLVTLTGTGGVGKTRTALHVARHAQRTFADGAWFVELESIRDPTLVPEVVLETLKVPDSSSRDPGAVLVDYLRGRHVLLVLDNCEHLVSAVTGLVATLMRECARVHVLATSIQSLDAPGEAVFQIEPLAVPEGEGQPGQDVSTFAAVELFAARARAVLGAFDMDDATQSAVVQLCAKLEGLPLGLELAAARLKVMTVGELASRLDDKFRILRGTSVVRAPRHQTMLAAVTWSHELCSPAEQILWQRASVFSGSFTLNAAEEVCSGSDLPADQVMDALHGLVDKSVVTRAEENGTMRFSMLGTIRSFGLEKLVASGESADARVAHCDWVTAMTMRAAHEWVGPEQLRWTRELRLEHDNIRSALAFCATTPEHAPRGQQLAGALWFHWIACGFLSEGRLWLGRVLAAGPEPSAARTLALSTSAFVGLLQGDLEQAHADAAESEQMARDVGAPELIGYGAHVQALCAFLENRPTEAEAHYARARAEYATTRPPEGLPLLLDLCLAVLYLATGDHPGTVDLFRELEATAEQIGDQWIRSYAVWGRGVLSLEDASYEEAEASLIQSLTMKQPFNDVLGLGLALDMFAWVLGAKGDSRRAARILGASSTLWAGIGPLLLGIDSFKSQRLLWESHIRSALGDAEYEKEFRAGAEAPVERTVDHLLNPAAARRPSQNGGSSVLTRREQEVAQLVAEGLTNQEIAERLVISPRTAEGHVENTLRKLGFRSRSQLAVWVAPSTDTDS